MAKILAAFAALLLTTIAAHAQNPFPLSKVVTAAPTATVFSSVLPAAPSGIFRTSCNITNVGTTTGWCQAKGPGVTITTGNALPVGVGQQFLCSIPGSNVTIQDEIDCTCASGICAFVATSSGGG